MALLLTAPPGPEWPHRHSRSYYPTTQGNRTILRNRHSRHARARPWPSYPYISPPWERPASSNRRFLALVSHNWFNLLTAANRLAWKNLAATLTLKNFKGHLITPNGFQLYHHHERAWFTWWGTIGGLFRADLYTPTTAPPAPWTTLTTPTNFTGAAWASNGFSFFYDGTPGLDWHFFNLCIANYPPKPGRIFPGQFARLNGHAVEDDPPTGHYHAYAQTEGITAQPQAHATFQIRLMDLPYEYPGAPSLWAPAIITI